MNNSTNQLDINIFVTLYPTTGEYKFFSSAHGTFLRTDNDWVTKKDSEHFLKDWNTLKLKYPLPPQWNEARNQ